jgi:hypothetical protein
VGLSGAGCAFEAWDDGGLSTAEQSCTSRGGTWQAGRCPEACDLPAGCCVLANGCGAVGVYGAVDVANLGLFCPWWMRLRRREPALTDRARRLLRPTGPVVEKLSWEETARAMAASGEDWSAWEGAAHDGLEGVPWEAAVPVRDRVARARSKPRPGVRK